MKRERVLSLLQQEYNETRQNRKDQDYRPRVRIMPCDLEHELEWQRLVPCENYQLGYLHGIEQAIVWLQRNKT